MPDQNTFADALREPSTTSPSGLTVGISPTQRLSMAMRAAREDDPGGSVPDPGGTFTNWSPGVPNPYGSGIHAFEPNNVIFDAYRQAKATSDASKAADAAKAAADAQTISVPGATGNVPGLDSVLGQADGQVGTAVQKALDLARRAVPYVWGGITANGVDCSGLLYFVFNAAGIKVPRYRARDWGRIGVAVSVQDARPGDVIYYDEPGDTDHVGLYIGNGLMVQAPTTGDHVRVTSIGKPTSIRRVFDDTAFGQIATPDGGVTTSYGGTPYDPSRTAPISPTTGPVLQATPTLNRYGTGGRTKAI
jgi:cell wall-associated NlpC family hydrolase